MSSSERVIKNPKLDNFMGVIDSSPSKAKDVLMTGMVLTAVGIAATAALGEMALRSMDRKIIKFGRSLGDRFFGPDVFFRD